MEKEKEDEVLRLFNELKVDHGIKETMSLEKLWEYASSQWLETHSDFPTIDEIDSIIDEVRNGKETDH